MQPFPIKTITLKQCRSCGTNWSGENVQLNTHDQINIILVKIAHCPVCADEIAKETDRPGYRRVGKKIK